MLDRLACIAPANPLCAALQLESCEESSRGEPASSDHALDTRPVLLRKAEGGSQAFSNLLLSFLQLGTDDVKAANLNGPREADGQLGPTSVSVMVTVEAGDDWNVTLKNDPVLQVPGLFNKETENVHVDGSPKASISFPSTLAYPTCSANEVLANAAMPTVHQTVVVQCPVAEELTDFFIMTAQRLTNQLTANTNDREQNRKIGNLESSSSDVSTLTRSSVPVLSALGLPASRLIQNTQATAEGFDATALAIGLIYRDAGSQVRDQSGEGAGDCFLCLDSPELGTIRVHLSTTQSIVTARFMVGDERTRQLLISQQGELQQALTDVGFSLGGLDFRGGGDANASDQQRQHLEYWAMSCVTNSVCKASNVHGSTLSLLNESSVDVIV